MQLPLPNLTYSAVNAVYHLSLGFWIGGHLAVTHLALPLVEDRAIEADIHRRLRRLALVCLTSLWISVMVKARYFGDLEWFHLAWLACLGVLSLTFLVDGLWIAPRIERGAPLERIQSALEAVGLSAGIASLFLVN